MTKLVLSVAGAVSVLASAIALIDYSRKRTCEQVIEPPSGELAFALVAAAAGTVLTILGEKTDTRPAPALEEMLSSEDVALMNATPTDSAEDADI